MSKTPSIHHCIKQAIDDYFAHLDGESPCDLYQLVINEVEEALLSAVMQHAGDNQSKAKNWLGVSRTTLRKKLTDYRLLNSKGVPA